MEHLRHVKLSPEVAQIVIQASATLLSRWNSWRKQCRIYILFSYLLPFSVRLKKKYIYIYIYIYSQIISYKCDLFTEYNQLCTLLRELVANTWLPFRYHHLLKTGRNIPGNISTVYSKYFDDVWCIPQYSTRM